MFFIEEYISMKKQEKGEENARIVRASKIDASGDVPRGLRGSGLDDSLA